MVFVITKSEIFQAFISWHVDDWINDNVSLSEMSDQKNDIQIVISSTPFFLQFYLSCFHTLLSWSVSARIWQGGVKKKTKQ